MRKAARGAGADKRLPKCANPRYSERRLSIAICFEVMMSARTAVFRSFLRAGTLFSLALLLHLVGCGGARDNSTPPLQTLTPPIPIIEGLSSVAYDPGPQQLAYPTPGSVTDISGNSYSAVPFIAHSRISFTVPSGRNLLTGVLVHADSPWVQTTTISPLHQGADELHIQIFDESNSLIFWTLVNPSMPPQAFSTPVTSGSKITVWVDGNMGPGSIYLLNGAFHAGQSSTYSTYLPHAPTGYVVLGSSVPEREFKAFRPGSSVSVNASYAGNAREATIWASIFFERSNRSPYVMVASIPLSQQFPGVVGGKGVLSFPDWNGPAQVEILETINGALVFGQTVRVAIFAGPGAPAPAKLGVHVSSAGFPITADYNAALWGAGRCRVILRWEMIESQPGIFDFSKIDEVLDAARAQGMEPLGILGEISPGWVGTPGPAYFDAWSRYVRQAVQHFEGRIHYWDVFNEADIKGLAFRQNGFPDADIRMLSIAMDAIHAADPANRTVCCSTGSIEGLKYTRHVFEKRLLNKIDIVSTHPYEHYAPEEKEGLFDYLETMQAFQNLTGVFGHEKPVWGTEANWLLGPLSADISTTPEIDEHTQATYVVRANLLSMAHGIPYFLHSPFFNRLHPEVQVDTLAAYATMARMFANATRAQPVSTGEGVFAVTADTPGGMMGSLWTARHNATVSLSGVPGVQFFDMYGNAASGDTSSFQATPDPIYFTGPAGAVPSIQVLRAPPGPTWTSLPGFNTWVKNANSAFIEERSGAVRMISQPVLYDYQLTSDFIPVIPNQWYVVRLTLKLHTGNLSLFAIDPTSKGALIDQNVFISYPPDKEAHTAELRFNSGSFNRVKLVIAPANYMPTATDFELLQAAEISPL